MTRESTDSIDLAQFLDVKDAQMEFKKSAGDAGRFTGYGAVFGNVDEGRDIIEPGAFKSMLTKKNGTIKILMHHRLDMIVGEATVNQDTKGLRVDGQLNMKLKHAPEAYELMQDGSLDAMSVGFRVIDKGARWDDDRSVRVISKAELWEVSVVPFGMNRKAKITSVKSADQIGSVRDFERVLREMGYSRSGASAIASKGYGAYQREVDEHAGQRDAETLSSEMLAILQKQIATHQTIF